MLVKYYYNKYLLNIILSKQTSVKICVENLIQCFFFSIYWESIRLPCFTSKLLKATCFVCCIFFFYFIIICVDQTNLLSRVFFFRYFGSVKYSWLSSKLHKQPFQLNVYSQLYPKAIKDNKALPVKSKVISNCIRYPCIN